MLWYQKSREIWVKLGDKNSSFSHTQTIIRRKKNKIHKLQLPNGIWTTDNDILQDEAHTFYKNFFTTTQPQHNRIFNLGPHPLIDDLGSNPSLNLSLKKKSLQPSNNEAL